MIKEYGLYQYQICVAHDAADDQRPFKKLKWQPNTYNIVYTGSLFPGKGMEIIAQLIGRISNAHFHIVGGNDTEIESWSNKFISYSNYTFYGKVPPKETVNYRFSADLLIAPYLNKVEGIGGRNIGLWMSPLKMFEYMAAGKPILISGLPVISEVLVNEKNALFASPGNIEEWETQIFRLMNKPEIGNKIGKAARQEFEEKYTWGKRVEKIFAYLK